MTVRVITDSTNYIPGAELERLGIARVSLSVHDGSALASETDMDLGAFYRRLKDMRVLPTSSQPSPDEIRALFEKIVNDGDEAIGLFLSSGMSGTVQSAQLAADMVRESHPGASIAVFDTGSNSMQEGFAVLAAAEAAHAGADLAACEEAARQTTLRTRYLFAPRSLEYLRRGGRIGGASALLGSLLGITPILTVENGVVEVKAKVRTFVRALDTIADEFAADIREHGFRRAVVHSIAAREEAERFAADRIAPLCGEPVSVVEIGPVIGLHVGPAVGLVYETEKELRA